MRMVELDLFDFGRRDGPTDAKWDIDHQNALLGSFGFGDEFASPCYSPSRSVVISLVSP
jgi:hypothetical protein